LTTAPNFAIISIERGAINKQFTLVWYQKSNLTLVGAVAFLMVFLDFAFQSHTKYTKINLFFVYFYYRLLENNLVMIIPLLVLK